MKLICGSHREKEIRFVTHPFYQLLTIDLSDNIKTAGKMVSSYSQHAHFISIVVVGKEEPTLIRP